MNNNVYNVDFTRLLPEPLKNDETMLALGRAIAGELQRNIQLARLTIIYPRIDELDEATLDILARDLCVDWYNDAYPIAAKRAVIKSSVQIHKRLGTKYAVVKALSDLFPNTEVQEWFEYGGKPFHFQIKIYGSNVSGLKMLYLKIQYTKNLRSVMDSVEFVLIPGRNFEVYVGSRLAAVQKHICAEIKGGNNDTFTARGEYRYFAGLTVKTKRIFARLGG